MIKNNIPMQTKPYELKCHQLSTNMKYEQKYPDMCGKIPYL